MGKTLLMQAEENIVQYRTDAVIKRLETALADRRKYESILAVINKEIEEMNTLPLDEAYAKYGYSEGMRRF